MKIKDAMQILEQFKTVAGDDADCDIESLQLVGKAEPVWDQYNYGREKDKTKVGYYVAAKVYARDVPQQSIQYEDAAELNQMVRARGL